MTEDQLAHGDEIKAMTREAALGEFVRRQLRPLTARDELSRHLRIFNWETVRPTAVFRKLMSEEATPFMGLAVDLMRRFLPQADQRTLMVAAIWLLGQCSVFVRNREQLAGPPSASLLRRCRCGGMAGRYDHRLDCQRARCVGVRRLLKYLWLPQKSFLSATGCPKRMFEIQSTV